MAAVVVIADVITRLRALMAAYPGIGTDVTAGAELATLPAYTVEARAAKRDGTPRRGYVTRQYEIFVYVTEIPDISNYEALGAAKAACYAWIDPLVDYLTQTPRLFLSGAAREDLVHGIGDVFDSSTATPTPYRGKNYSAFLLDIPIVTIRQ